MTPELRTLYTQALDAAVPETWTTLTPAQLERFAEAFAHLILRSLLDTVNKS